MDGDFFQRVYKAVSRVPPGRVASYGQIATVVSGSPFAARTVGWALHALPEYLVDEVPWWRIVNVRGRISTSCVEHNAAQQRGRLVDEGIEFDDMGCIDLDRFGWAG
jgi:methylated-DNA-protein-cysteine methyltransferase-like protein